MLSRAVPKMSPVRHNHSFGSFTYSCKKFLVSLIVHIICQDWSQFASAHTTVTLTSTESCGNSDMVLVSLFFGWVKLYLSLAQCLLYTRDELPLWKTHGPGITPHCSHSFLLHCLLQQT